jgi:uncharacterized protein YjiS (DUF1127 family)
MLVARTNDFIWFHRVFNDLRAQYTNVRSSVKAATERRAKYHSVMFELSELTDRELNDIGISRADIRRIAREHIEGPVS